jgi:hypothetical protein
MYAGTFQTFGDRPDLHIPTVRTVAQRTIILVGSRFVCIYFVIVWQLAPSNWRLIDQGRKET